MRLALLVASFAISTLASAQNGAHVVTNTDPEKVRFITDDIERFWKAFDAFKLDTTSNPFQDYLTNGTPALTSLREYRIPDAEIFKKVVKRNLHYYEHIRNSPVDVHVYRQQVIKYLNRLKEIYPKAVFPDIYFVIWLMNTGGTTFNEGVIIGTEKFVTDTSRVEGYGNWTISAEKLPFIVAAGAVFFQQKPAHTGNTLLRQCVIQGSADFVTGLILGEDKHLLFDAPNYRYGEQYEEALVKEFLKVKDSDDFSGWLYSKHETRPADLGYYIGYKITEAYYNNAPDKTRALDEILKINDFERFLQLSGYAEQFRN
jgi:hypothetical protein